MSFRSKARQVALEEIGKDLPEEVRENVISLWIEGNDEHDCGKLMPSCFPATATVLDVGGNRVHLKDVRLGQKILTVDASMNLSFEKILLVFHRHLLPTVAANTSAADLTEYVRITSATGAALHLTEDHLLFVNGCCHSSNLKAARQVNVRARECVCVGVGVCVARKKQPRNFTLTGSSG
jgi:hypothetical protein